MISCGVPLIYINDLSNVCKRLMAILFADDTNMFNSSKDIETLQSVVNEELKLVSTWLKVNKLSLNIKKTHFMVFTKKRNAYGHIDIKIDEESIQEVANLISWCYH